MWPFSEKKKKTTKGQEPRCAFEDHDYCVDRGWVCPGCYAENEPEHGSEPPSFSVEELAERVSDLVIKKLRDEGVI